MPLYELERCWGQVPGSPIPHAARPATERRIRSLDDVHAAMDHFVGQLAAAPVLSIATHISTDIAFRSVSDEEMAAALALRNAAGPSERDTYASYVHEAFLTALEAYGDRIVLQFSFGAEPLPHETGSIAPQRSIAYLADMAAATPRCGSSASYPAATPISPCARSAGNCRTSRSRAIGGTTSSLGRSDRSWKSVSTCSRPTSKSVSSPTPIDRVDVCQGRDRPNQLAQVLEQKVRQGQYTVAEALAVAKAILYDAPQQLTGMKPV